MTCAFWERSSTTDSPCLAVIQAHTLAQRRANLQQQDNIAPSRWRILSPPTVSSSSSRAASGLPAAPAAPSPQLLLLRGQVRQADEDAGSCVPKDSGLSLVEEDVNFKEGRLSRMRRSPRKQKPQPNLALLQLGDRRTSDAKL